MAAPKKKVAQKAAGSGELEELREEVIILKEVVGDQGDLIDSLKTDREFQRKKIAAQDTTICNLRTERRMLFQALKDSHEVRKSREAGIKGHATGEGE